MTSGPEPLASPAKKAATAGLTRKGERTRGAILVSARRVFAERGYTGARMTDIADGAGLSLGALYRYFKDKDAIFEELFEELHERFLTVTRTGPLDADNLAAGIHAANLRYFELYELERELMRAVVEASAVEDRYMARWSVMYDEIAARFLRRLAQLGSVKEVTPQLEHSVFALVCMTEQVAYVNFARRQADRTLGARELADAVTDLWLTGISGHDGFRS